RSFLGGRGLEAMTTTESGRRYGVGSAPQTFFSKSCQKASVSSTEIQIPNFRYTSSAARG
ncbi:MAG: hypothetical protein MH204_06570, partial [Fimbriimonadaceae bacterium]|nr:hypothetical protein [Fimbriimonadaceae bacterium]